MEVVKFIYEGNEISFEPNARLMINATEMAKIYNEEPRSFLKTEEAKKFIKACLSSENLPNSGIEKEEDLIYVNQRHGTFMHRLLAIRFAIWLDPNFAVWVIKTIEQILFGQYEEMKEATIEKLEAEEKRDRRLKELMESNPEFYEFMKLQAEVDEKERKRVKAVKESMNQLRIDFIKNKKSK